MKLSEAILLGSVTTPQARFTMYAPNGGTCALGAAADAAGFLNREQFSEQGARLGIYRRLGERWPLLHSRLSPDELSPSGRYVYGNNPDLMVVIQDRNDVCGWTRPQIAEWVATLEAEQEQRTACEPVAEEVGEVCEVNS